MGKAVMVLSLLLCSTASWASSDDAWREFNQDVAAKCKAASGLKRAHVSEVIGFDDSLGKVAVLVSGTYSQPALKGAQGKMLCIYDQQSKKTWVSEATGWRAPDMRQPAAPKRSAS